MVGGHGSSVATGCCTVFLSLHPSISLSSPIYLSLSLQNNLSLCVPDAEMRGREGGGVAGHAVVGGRGGARRRHVVLHRRGGT